MIIRLSKDLKTEDVRRKLTQKLNQGMLGPYTFVFVESVVKIQKYIYIYLLYIINMQMAN